MDEPEIQRALASMCNQGPYSLDMQQSNNSVQAWKCQTCGAVLKFGTTVSIPSWVHYKPGCEPARIPQAFYKAFEL